MDVDALAEEERRRWAELGPEQRAFVEQREPIWRRAHEIVAERPDLDVGDVYHVLVSWNEAPARRLERALRRGRLLARAG